MMRLALGVVLLLFFCTLHTEAQAPDPPRPDIYWFEQKFDHFNETDNRYFKQKYLVYDKYYNGTGPIFFTPGGESFVIGGYDHNGFMFELAERLGAFLLFPEHRFYGNSLPFGPVDSYLPENIKQLKIEQAMKDYVEIIKWVKVKFGIGQKNPARKTPLIAFGGSYPGDLAVWMRVAYPDVVDAAMGSSAPIRYITHGAVQGGTFFKTVTNDFSKEHPECPDMMRKSFAEVYRLWNEGGDSINAVVKGLKLCYSPSPDAKGLRLLSLWAENAFAGLGMENYPYPLDNLPGYPMLAACQVMYDAQQQSKQKDGKVSSEVLLNSLALSVGIVYNSTGEQKCFNISKEYYPCADITGCGGGVGDPNAMSWDYQSCTELIANVDTNNVTDMFPPAKYDYDSLVDYCKEQWDAEPKPSYIPEKYNYTTTTRLILSNGALDPWGLGGIIPSLCPKDKDMFCPLIPMAAHHLDLRGSDPVNDPQAVVDVRKKEDEIIIRWVNEIQALPSTM